MKLSMKLNNLYLFALFRLLLARSLKILSLLSHSGGILSLSISLTLVANFAGRLVGSLAPALIFYMATLGLDNRLHPSRHTLYEISAGGDGYLFPFLLSPRP